MVDFGSSARRIEFTANNAATLYARPADWPGIARNFTPGRKYSSRWTNPAPEHYGNEGGYCNKDTALMALIEDDMRVFFGEYWDLVTARPRVMSAVFGIVIGYVFWA